MAYFLNELVVFYQANIEEYKTALKSSISKRKSNTIFTSVKELMKVQSSIYLPSVIIIQTDFKSVIKELTTNNVPKLDR